MTCVETERLTRAPAAGGALTGWFRHNAIRVAGRYLAHAEKFCGGRPIPEGERVGTIRTGEGATCKAAESALEYVIERAEK